MESPDSPGGFSGWCIEQGEQGLDDGAGGSVRGRVGAGASAAWLFTVVTAVNQLRISTGGPKARADCGTPGPPSIGGCRSCRSKQGPGPRHDHQSADGAQLTGQRLETTSVAVRSSARVRSPTPPRTGRSRW